MNGEIKTEERSTRKEQGIPIREESSQTKRSTSGVGDCDVLSSKSVKYRAISFASRISHTYLPNYEE